MTKVPQTEQSSDSAAYRTQTNVGFNARVEPLWFTYHRLACKLGILARWRERRRIRRIVSRANAQLKEQGVSPDSWDQASGECVSNLRVARMGLSAELHLFLRANTKEGDEANWKHLFAQRERDAIALPIDFPEPFTLSSGPTTLQVTSSFRLRQELEQANTVLKIEKALALVKMSKIDFIDANEKDISVYESRFSTLDGFWPKFAYVLFKKLADKSLETKFPILFA